MKALKKKILENGKSDEEFLEIFKETAERIKYQKQASWKYFNVLGEETNLQNSPSMQFPSTDNKNFMKDKSEYLEKFQDDYYYNINEIYNIPGKID